MSNHRIYYPTYTTPHLRKKPLLNTPLTIIFILLNLLLFIVFLVLVSINKNYINFFALNPSNILSGKYLWTIILSVFMHGKLTHLFVNMVSLLFIGSFVEKLIGRKRYLWFYLLSGIAANLFFVLLAFLFNKDLNVYAVGASGALFALGGLLMVLLPKLKVYIFFILPMPLYIGMIFMLAVLWFASLTAGLPIGNTAHLGGLIAGILYGWHLRKRYRRKVALLNRIFR